jgi:hypothetical protein
MNGHIVLKCTGQIIRITEEEVFGNIQLKEQILVAFKKRVI